MEYHVLLLFWQKIYILIKACEVYLKRYGHSAAWGCPYNLSSINYPLSSGFFNLISHKAAPYCFDGSVAVVGKRRK